jgi:4-amino-4-deoxy-L-arabinose transferase-like glycosyltransferase
MILKPKTVNSANFLHRDPPNGGTMPEPGPNPGADLPASRSIALDLGLVVLASLIVFGYDLRSEPPFADESAYYTQAYFADLLLRGDLHNVAWLEYPAYDLPPLPKYAIGLALKLGGHPILGPWAARAWYADINRRFYTPGAEVAARRPTVLFGALGCAAIYALGMLARDRRAGLLAAGLLLVNPLYYHHARRAMSDVPAEALILASLALGLWAWRRFLSGRIGPGSWLLAALAGFCGGLATLAKLNGALALIVIAAWAGLAVGLLKVPLVRKFTIAAAAVVSGLVALGVFTLLNPFLTAQPRRALAPGMEEFAHGSILGRAHWLVAHRMSVSRGQQDLFSTYALRTPAEKLEAVAVQGFGRFGPLGPGRDDSTRRFDWRQDWGALVWEPCVLAGVFWAFGRGLHQRRRGEPPTAWALLIQAGVAALAVTAYLPLAWDRYYLSLQPGSALLAAGAIVAAFDRLARLVTRHAGRA